jgi:hypothetical protein
MQIVHTGNMLIAVDFGPDKRETRPLLRDSAPHQQGCNSLTEIKIWS